LAWKAARQDFPVFAAVLAARDVRIRGTVTLEREGIFDGARHEHQPLQTRMHHQPIWVADAHGSIGQVRPGLAAVSTSVETITARHIKPVRVGWINHQPVDVGMDVTHGERSQRAAPLPGSPLGR
jgi:hypothetical protein